MALTCYLLSRERKKPPDNVESRALRYKYQLIAINMVSFAAAGYFFIRHNRHCEPYGMFLTTSIFIQLKFSPQTSIDGWCPFRYAKTTQ